MKTTIIGFLVLATCQLAHTQTFSEKINKELTFEKPGSHTLMIFNINGNVRVTGTTGDKVILEAERVITGKTERRLEIGKTQLQLGIMDRADTIMLYVEGSCNHFGKMNHSRRGWINGRRQDEWGYQWNNDGNNHDCREEFDYRLNFTIRVPAGINLYASTINDGDVVVENVGGKVNADNINGNISLKNIAGATHASTINGSVDLEYSKNPPDECRYYSLNGDINAWFRKGLTADLSFESFNGALYTNVDDVESKPAAVVQKSSEPGIRYKIGGNQFKIGKGGVLLDFETFNGDVYLREKTD